jgi:hypothetical protein
MHLCATVSWHTNTALSSAHAHVCSCGSYGLTHDEKVYVNEAQSYAAFRSAMKLPRSHKQSDDMLHGECETKDNAAPSAMALHRCNPWFFQTCKLNMVVTLRVDVYYSPVTPRVRAPKRSVACTAEQMTCCDETVLGLLLTLLAQLRADLFCFKDAQPEQG